MPDIAVTIADLEKPPQAEMGDLAFGCFALAKSLRQAPPKIAADLATAIQSTVIASAAKQSQSKYSLIASAVAAGPYVNFKFDTDVFAASVLNEVGTAKEGYGRVSADQKGGRGQVMVEYGSANTHKEFHVGHLRNVFVGLAASKLLEAVGWKVISVKYPGDIGSHVAKCLWALRKFHAGETLPENKGKYLGQIYTEASRLVEENESYKEEAAEVQRKLEARDPELTALWQQTRQWSLDELEAIFVELGAHFDKTYFESEVEEPGKQLVRELLEKGIAKHSQGATIIDLEAEGLGAFLVLKSDGSSLYSTKELALALRKFAEYELDESIHVVDNRQSHYFLQLFAALRRMGFNKKMVHLSHDFVTLKEGAMSSRKGNIIAYEDFRDELVQRVAEETRKRRDDWDENKIERAALVIAGGAMKFGMLKQGMDRPIVFDIEDALSFDGFTGPYIQYAHARLSSILGKAAAEAEKLPGGKVGQFDLPEYRALRVAADLPELVRQAAERLDPSILAQYLFDLAQAANDFYRDAPILTAEPADKARRLAIAEALRQCLENGLRLLGIEAPEEM